MGRKELLAKLKASKARKARIGDIMEDVKRQAGLLLPDVDPNIGEIVLATFSANPGIHPAALLAVLARQAPNTEVAAELVSAGFELVLCREKGHLAWLADRAGDYLIGIRKLTVKDGWTVGGKSWPMVALMSGPPLSVTVRIANGFRQVWAACDGLAGVVMRQSEVIAFGNALIERFGGRVVEDRAGPEVLKHGVIEARMTERAKARAEANARLERLTVLATGSAGPRGDHARVAMAEAFPGTVANGTVVHPEGFSLCRYVVELRVNESWVLLVAEGPGRGYEAQAGVWVAADRLVDAGEDAAVGFTDDDAIAPAAPTQPVVLAIEVIPWPEGKDGAEVGGVSGPAPEAGAEAASPADGAPDPVAVEPTGS